LFYDRELYYTVNQYTLATLAACAKLTAEQKKAIENYSKQIKTIELFVDSVRQNPGEYLSSIGDEGWINACREVIQNGTDEMGRDVSPCDTVWIEYFDGINRMIVADNGRGIPAKDIVRVFTREHTSTNFVKEKGVYPSGLHGVGAKCTNAISSRFAVTSFILGKAYFIEFSEGKPLPKYKNGPKEIPNKGDRQGLLVDFEPDLKIMKKITIGWRDILNLLENLVPLIKIGSKIEFIGHDVNGKTFKKTLVNENGIGSYIERMISPKNPPIIKPIIFGYDNGVMKVESAFVYTNNLNASANILTFANVTPVDTLRSTPSQGFFQGLYQFFRNYMNKIYLSNNRSKLEVINSDIGVGIVGAVAAAHMDVMFDGQAKNVCKNEDFVEFCKSVTFKALEAWSKNNPEDLQKVCEFIKGVATARNKANKEKDKISNKFKGNSFIDAPQNYAKPENKKNIELLIVEGLSAGSSAKAGRDTRTQGIYPIRGKMPNALSTPKQRFLNNEEVQGLLAVIDQGGYGKSFDLKKCPFDKIILMPDADYDGFHIRLLILLFLLVYCRPLIDAGMVYCVISPLYHINKGTKKWRYFTDRNEFIRYVRDQFMMNNKVQHERSKKVFDKTEFLKLIETNNNYDLNLAKISDNYAIYPVLLEDLLILRNESFSKIKSLLEKKYPYLHVNKHKGVIMLEGYVNDLSTQFIFNDHLINACKPIIPYIDRSEKRYLVNGTKMGLYELIRLYRLSEPKNIERAKGLGSLKPYELGASTLNPKNRKLIRYTASDIEAEIAELRKVNDDKFVLLKDVDISEYEF